nr:hypothetical protein [Micromonospora sp. DSM 115978]
HYLEEAGELADRLAIMHRGRVVRSGTPAEVAASQPARIGFALPPDRDEPVPVLPAATSVTTPPRGGYGRIVVETDDVQRTLTALLDWANQLGIRLLDLDARSASLEEAFLAIGDGLFGDGTVGDGTPGDADTSGAVAEVAA